MYGKKLFSLLNAICIAITIFVMWKIVCFKSKESKIKKNYILILLTGLFLFLGEHKYLMYWVAGSVNYIWVFTLLIIFSYYYLKVGLNKHKIINCLILFLLSALHECAFVFLLFLIISDLIKDIIESDKKHIIRTIIPYLFYIGFAVLGVISILKAPGNLHRIANNQYWYDMSFFKRLSISIPVVSIKLLKLFNFNNLVPTIFVITFIIYCFKNKLKTIKIFGFLIMLVSIISLIFNNGWLYFVIAILIFITVILINYFNKENEMSVLWIAFYSSVFSMIITPEYSGARPNYYMYIWMIINICLYISYIVKNKKIIKSFQVVSILMLIFTCICEYKIYTYIGDVHRLRLKEIEYVNENHLKVLKLKKIDDNYIKFHADANAPANNDYWTYVYFRNYYGIAEDVVLELVE